MGKPARTPMEPWVASRIGLAPEQPLTRETIQDAQLSRLRGTLSYVKERSAFYRRRLADFHAHLARVEDLAHLPFTSADDLRQNPGKFLCVSQSDIRRVVTLDTSGTTGDPKRLYFTVADQELTVDFFHHGVSTFTNPGDRVLILLPGERPGSVGDLLSKALRRLGAEGIQHGPSRPVPQTLDVAVEQHVDGLVGTPVQALALARYGESVGRAPQHLRNVLLSTDRLSPAISAALEQAWGCAVYDHYGMTEMGLGGGVECQARQGYHMREADLYVEIVDPLTGEALDDGRQGEIVFTTLTRKGMPLIRYRTGDAGSFMPARCPCGTVLKTLTRVAGRIAEGVDLGAEGCLTMPDLDDAIFSSDGVVDSEATIAGERNRGRLCIRVATVRDRGAAVSRSIRQCIDSIRSVRLARESGRLDVVVDVQTADWSRMPGPRLTKRKIIDRRSF